MGFHRDIFHIKTNLSTPDILMLFMAEFHTLLVDEKFVSNTYYMI